MVQSNVQSNYTAIHKVAMYVTFKHITVTNTHSIILNCDSGNFDEMISFTNIQ